MRKIVDRIILLLFFTPLLGFIFYNSFENFSFYDLCEIIFFFIFLILLISKKISFPKYYYLYVFYLLYILAWSFKTKTGSKQILDVIGIFSFLVIIKNISVRPLTTSRLITLMKLTIIISFIVSFIQYDSDWYFGWSKYI